MKKIVSWLLCSTLLLGVFSLPAAAYSSKEPVNDTAGQILEGIFNGTTYEVERNDIVIEPDQPGLSDEEKNTRLYGFHFPDFVWVEDTLYAYFIKWNDAEGKCGIGLATSDDGGLSFDYKGMVIYPGESYDMAMASFPGVWYENGTFYIVYESEPAGGHASIALATSADGIHFTKQGLIIQYDPAVKWQKGNIGTPDLFKEGDTWYVTFHAFGINESNPDSNRNYDNQICVAYGTDLKNLTVHPEPVIKASTVADAIDSGTLGRRDIIKYGGYYYMIYEVSSDAAPGHAYYDFSGSMWSHTVARSKDMINWEKAPKPLYEPTKAGFSHDGPAWLVKGDEVYIYYREYFSVDAGIRTKVAQLSMDLTKADPNTGVKADVNSLIDIAAPAVTEGKIVDELNAEVGLVGAALYNVSMTKNGSDYTPAEPVTLYFPLGGIDPDKAALRRYDADGNIAAAEQYEVTGDGYIKIKTASLGQYAVLEQLGDFIIGDVDFSGKIDTADALKILQSSVGKITFDKNVAYIADVDGDHAVRTSDALLVLQKSVGKIERFPVEETA